MRHASCTCSLGTSINTTADLKDTLLQRCCVAGFVCSVIGDWLLWLEEERIMARLVGNCASCVLSSDQLPRSMKNCSGICCPELSSQCLRELLTACREERHFLPIGFMRDLEMLIQEDDGDDDDDATQEAPAVEQRGGGGDDGGRGANSRSPRELIAYCFDVMQSLQRRHY